MREQASSNKPSWEDAPAWANSLGVADWDCDYRGEWCWIAGENPSFFLYLETRPKTTEEI